MTMASDGNCLTGLWFDGQKYDRDGLSAANREKMLPVFADACRWMDLYFSGKEPDFMLPLAMKTTAFRRMVWESLLTIPYGQTITYGQLARQIAARQGADRMSAQAVGGAVGHNPISIIIPCHRVVGANGSLTGYAGGIERKMKLLELERTQKLSHTR